MFCTKCGAQLPENARFCTSCGAPVVPAKTEVSAAASAEKDLPVVVQEPSKDMTKPAGNILARFWNNPKFGWAAQQYYYLLYVFIAIVGLFMLLTELWIVGLILILVGGSGIGNWWKWRKRRSYTECPNCGKDTFRKELSAPGFELKGSGWAATDFGGGPKALKGVWHIALGSGIAFVIPEFITARFVGAELPAVTGSVVCMAVTILLSKVLLRRSDPSYALPDAEEQGGSGQEQDHKEMKLKIVDIVTILQTF